MKTKLINSLKLSFMILFIVLFSIQMSGCLHDDDDDDDDDDITIKLLSPADGETLPSGDVTFKWSVTNAGTDFTSILLLDKGTNPYDGWIETSYTITNGVTEYTRPLSASWWGSGFVWGIKVNGYNAGESFYLRISDKASDHTDNDDYGRSETSSQNYEGTWSGTTDQGENISFLVEGDKIPKIAYEVNISGRYCSATVTGGMTSSGYPITNGQCDFGSTSSGFSGRITFSNSSSCTATWRNIDTYCQADNTGTFTASKRGENECTDADSDGYYAQVNCATQVDCNDSNASVNPGATEICDGVDNNCDSQIDEGGVCP